MPSLLYAQMVKIGERNEETHKKLVKDHARLVAGLEEIQKVLDYATDSGTARYNMMMWAKNAVDGLLAV